MKPAVMGFLTGTRIEAWYMAEDEEEINELDFEALKEAAEERRSNRRSQVTYEEVERIREAGERYRSQGSVDVVAGESDQSMETTEEYLTVYRLIFNDPPYIRREAVDAGRGFFSLEKSVEEEVDEDVEDPVEDLLREYVGAIYLERDVKEELVGEPVEVETPPFSDKRRETLEKFAESFTLPTESLLAASTVANIGETLTQTQAQAVASAVEPLVRQREEMIASAVAPLIQHRNQMLARSLAPLVSAVESQQTQLAAQMAELVSNAAWKIDFPDPVIADLASLQPSVTATAAASTTPATGSSITAEASTASVSPEPLETTATTVPEPGPVDATVDATLPDMDSVSAELVVELPALIVQSMLSTGQARVWFTNLPEDHQITAVRILLAAVVVSITGNPFFAPIAIIPAPAVRRAIILNDEEDE